MAERFGGPYSKEPPAKDGRNGWHGLRPAPLAARANLLFLWPLPLAVRAFFQPDAAGLVLTLAGFGALMLAAWLTRAGLEAETAYIARKRARRPAIPRKIFGSVLTGIGLFAAVLTDGGPVAAALLGGLGVVLHSAAFGFDPLTNKNMDDIDTFQQDRVARAVQEGEKHLAAMKEAAHRAGDRHVDRQVEVFQATARDLFHIVQDDPRDLTAARRYLGVYLLGAREAAEKFAEIYLRTGDAAVRQDFLDLLVDLEQGFATRSRAMLLDDKTDLDVEIEVLRERLAREAAMVERHVAGKEKGDE